jgi:hypothetical protein
MLDPTSEALLMSSVRCLRVWVPKLILLEISLVGIKDTLGRLSRFKDAFLGDGESFLSSLISLKVLTVLLISPARVLLIGLPLAL